MLTSEKIDFVFRKIIDSLRQDTYFSGNYSSYILPLICLKWLSDLYKNNDLQQNKPNTKISISKRFNWLLLENLLQDIGKEVTNIFYTLEEENPKLKGVFIDPTSNQWERINDYTLQSIIQNISMLEFNKNYLREPDLLGEMYENFLMNIALHDTKKNANYFTPTYIRKLMVDLIKPQVKQPIYDPACGSGGLLIESVCYLKNQGEVPSNILVYGHEEDYELRSTAITNLFLHGIEQPNIVSESIIKHPPLTKNGELKKFDVIITNPPFGVKNWEDYQAKHEAFQNFKYGDPPKSSADYAFIQCILAMLSDSGKAGIIVPHGVLFRGGIEGEIRERIVKDDLIEAIIGLPQNLFYNTRIATAIIIFNKKKLDSRKKNILFIDASSEYVSNRRQNFINDEIISRIVSTYVNFQEEPSYSKIASHDEISQSNYILNISSYVKYQELESNLDVESQVKKVQMLEAQRVEIETQMDDCLKSLGIKT